MDRKIYYVVLNDNGMNTLDSKSFKKLRRDTRFFKCSKIEPKEPYFYMEIEDSSEKKEILELSIPHHYVSYFFSGENSEKILGFK